MFVAAGAWWLVSEANQRNDSRGTSLLSYPAVLNSYPFPVIHPRAKEGLNTSICMLKNSSKRANEFRNN